MANIVSGFKQEMGQKKRREAERLQQQQQPSPSPSPSMNEAGRLTPRKIANAQRAFQGRTSVRPEMQDWLARGGRRGEGAQLVDAGRQQGRETPAGGGGEQQQQQGQQVQQQHQQQTPPLPSRRRRKSKAPLLPTIITTFLILPLLFLSLPFLFLSLPFLFPPTPPQSPNTTTTTKPLPFQRALEFWTSAITASHFAHFHASLLTISHSPTAAEYLLSLSPGPGSELHKPLQQVLSTLIPMRLAAKNLMEEIERRFRRLDDAITLFHRDVEEARRLSRRHFRWTRAAIQAWTDAASSSSSWYRLIPRLAWRLDARLIVLASGAETLFPCLQSQAATRILEALTALAEEETWVAGGELKDQSEGCRDAVDSALAVVGGDAMRFEVRAGLQELRNVCLWAGMEEGFGRGHWAVGFEGFMADWMWVYLQAGMKRSGVGNGSTGLGMGVEGMEGVVAGLEGGLSERLLLGSGVE